MKPHPKNNKDKTSFDEKNQELIKTVLYNCDVSDACHAGAYSICGLALRLRDLYKWENGLEPWIEKDSAQILDWIDAREKKWETLADAPFEKLPLNGIRHDPFEVSRINRILIPRDMFYGALYAQSLKPMFFMAAIEENLTVEELPVYLLGEEYARDLMTVPALNLDGNIIVRKSSACLHLWDQIVYIKKSGRPALEFALSHLGLRDFCPVAIQENLPQLLSAQMDTYIYHEVGEMRQTVFDRDQWRRIIATYPQTTVELLARASKDLLADTHMSGPLRRMIQTRNKVGLALYAAFSDGLLRELFPEIRSAFAEFAQHQNWELIETAVDHGQSNGRWWAERLMQFHAEGLKRDDPDWARDRIEKQFADYMASKTKP